jgi:hypothetical protein
MADIVHIPQWKEGDDWMARSPAWLQPHQDGRPLKPLIRCNCGQWSGIRLHHVHVDGRVTNSFFHATKAQHPQGDDSGCGWHVFLILDGYNGGDFPPGIGGGS